MAALAALGATYTDLVLNAIYRGSVGTPPSTIYLSLGAADSVLTPVEITTRRTPVKITRGWLSGMDSATYPYQSTGSVVGRSNLMHEGYDIYCAGMGSNVYANPTILIYDAASAGNLLAAVEPSWTDFAQVINGDIVRLGSPNLIKTEVSSGFSSYFVLTVPTSTTDHASLFLRASNPTYQLGAYMYAILTDWLWRGYDSMNELFSPSTYPNVYGCMVNTNTGNDFAGVDRVAIPRSAGTWSAPAYVSAGTNLERKITNLVDITFPAATTGGSYAATAFVIRMSNVVQSFDDRLYTIFPFGTITYSAGDIISFPAGSLEIVFN